MQIFIVFCVFGIAQRVVNAECLAPQWYDAAYGAYEQATAHRGWDLGDYDSCIAGGYQHCLINSNVATTGVCIPAGCGPAELSNFSHPIWTGYLFAQQPGWLLLIAALGGSLVITPTCGTNQIPWGNAATGTSALMLLLACWVVFATCYAVAYPQTARAGKGNSGLQPPQALDSVLRGTSLTFTVPPLLGQGRDRPTAAGKAVLDSLDGMRVLAMCCVVLGHSSLNNIYAATNGQTGLTMAASPAGQAVPSAEYSVDTFFVISGCLASYLCVPQLSKVVRPAPVRRAEGLDLPLLDSEAEMDTLPQPSRVETSLRCLGVWLLALLRRYFRLIPSVAVLYLLHSYLIPALFANGPQGFNWKQMVQACTSDGAWWKMLILVANFADGPPSADAGLGTLPSCLPHLWYLDAEFQIFAVLVIPLCALYVNSYSKGLVASAVCFLALFCAGIAICFVHKLSWMQPSVSANLTGNYVDHFYALPWTRAPAFLAGMALGFSLLRYEVRSASEAECGTKSTPWSTTTTVVAVNSPPVQDAEVNLSYSGWLNVATSILPSTPAPVGSPSPRQVDVWSSLVMCVTLSALGVLYYLPSLPITAGWNGVYLLNNCPECEAWSDDAVMLWGGTCHALWAGVLSVLVYQCATGRAGLLADVLGHKAWRPLARLSYWVYLIHFDVIYVTDYSSTQFFRFGAVSLALSYAGNLTLAIVAAAILHLLVEMPAAAVERAVFRRASDKAA